MPVSITLPDTTTSRLRGSRALIYFICGNPGLIEYYADYLAFLRGLLDAADHSTAYDIYGRNLFGFSDDDHAPFSADRPPWDVDGMVEAVYDDIAAKKPEGKDKAYDFVVLMGHSLGCYIAVDIFHRHMKKPRAPHLQLRHGMLLFPTLTHIAHSPRGRALMSLLGILPVLNTRAPQIARWVLGLFSLAVVRWILLRILGLPETPAEVTAQWLKSRDGVWQSIHLGLSEMQTICEDRWDEEIWEVSESEQSDQAPKFFMFYGKDDHWVANEIRDEFIQKRREHGEKGGRTHIAVDEGDLPHAFCLKEESSYILAKRASEWIEAIEKGTEHDR